MKIKALLGSAVICAVGAVATSPVQAVSRSKAALKGEMKSLTERTTASGSVEVNDIRETCDITNYNAKCAHTMGADSARTADEAKIFFDRAGQDFGSMCFGNYKMYYSNSCKAYFGR